MKLFTHIDATINKLSKTTYLKSVTFCIAFLEASISPILPEAFLLVVLAYRKDISWKILSLISAAGSTAGALFMYSLGAIFYTTYGQSLLSFLHGEAVAEKAKALFAQNAFYAQFFAALTPLPDRVFSFLAGAFLVSVPIIIAATFLGRLIRVAPVAYLSYEYGDEARVYIKRHTKKATITVAVGVIIYILYAYLK
jgi:membrane protein YqaA with SNARE-associated domain